MYCGNCGWVLDYEEDVVCTDCANQFKREEKGCPSCGALVEKGYALCPGKCRRTPFPGYERKDMKYDKIL